MADVTPVPDVVPPPRFRSKPLLYVPLVVKNPSINAGDNHLRYPKPTAEENNTSRFELFLLGDGEKKVSETPDTRK